MINLLVQNDLLGNHSKPLLLEEYNEFGGHWKLYINAFSSSECSAFLDALINAIPWQQENIQMYGKRMKTPRLTSWHGDPGRIYKYSGVSYSPEPWTDELLTIREKATELANVEFNSVLLNLYRDGSDGVSWHADDEAELGENPTIASVSFGAVRDFHLRHNKHKELRIPTRKYPLTAGSVLIMKGETQSNWQHQVPKRSTDKYSDARVNLTFRVIHT